MLGLFPIAYLVEMANLLKFMYSRKAIFDVEPGGACTLVVCQVNMLSEISIIIPIISWSILRINFAFIFECFICYAAYLMPPKILCSSLLLFKFRISEKATKFDKIFTVNLTVFSDRQMDGEDFVNFCSLLRQHKLYQKISMY